LMRSNFHKTCPKSDAQQRFDQIFTSTRSTATKTSPTGKSRQKAAR
jgi:hypothetical protein